MWKDLESQVPYGTQMLSGCKSTVLHCPGQAAEMYLEKSVTMAEPQHDGYKR